MTKTKTKTPKIMRLDGQHYRAAWEPFYQVYREQMATEQPMVPMLTFEEFATVYALPPHSAFMR